jgi:uncharacterized membrane protein
LLEEKSSYNRVNENFEREGDEMSEIPPPSVPPSMPPPGGTYTPPPPPPPGSVPPPSSSDRTIFLVLSYVGILSLVPLLAKKDDAEVQWHAKNGVVLFGAEVIWVIVRIILSRIPAVACGMVFVGCIVWLGFLAISIICIMKAVQGQRFRIPILTDIAEKM